MKTILAIAALVALTGCATTSPSEPAVTPDQISDSLVGSKPSEEDLKSFVANMMKDPESVKFKMGKTHKCYGRGAPISGGKITRYGWCTRMAASGKNSYGAYVGYTEVRIFTSSLGQMQRYVGNPWFTEEWLRP